MTRPGPAPIVLVSGRAEDRARVGRVRPPREMAFFVHYNWFWLDRSLADPAISFDLARSGPRRRLVGVVACGPHETRDQDPASRLPDCGEVFHVVVDRRATRRGYGHAIVGLAIRALLDANPTSRACASAIIPTTTRQPDYLPISASVRSGSRRITRRARVTS